MKLLVPIFFIFFLIPVAGAQDAGMDNSFLYVAHRGASYLAPENTLASILLAWELGADGAECDVMLTADDQVILFHDKNARKLTGENINIKDASWDQLKSLKVIPRASNRPEFSQEPIPLLKDVLATIPPDRMLVIEIKTGPEILPHLKRVVDEHWKTGKISFIAFDFETIKQARTLYPAVPCYYLAMFRADFKKHLAAASQNGLTGVDLRHTIIDRKLMERCRNAGLEVWCWTVNEPEAALEMKALGVRAVTTDRPAWLKERLENYP